MKNTSDFGPGTGAFVAFLVLAIVLWLLMKNMNARLRRMSYADRDEDRAVAQAQETSQPSAAVSGMPSAAGAEDDSPAATGPTPEEPEAQPRPGA